METASPFTTDDVPLGRVRLCRWRFIHTGVLAGVPAVMYGLTGTSAAAYLLNKSLQNNAPAITSVTPATIKQGGTIHIRGTNLFPGQDVRGGGHPAAVLVGGYEAANVTWDVNNDEIAAIAS